MDEPREPGAHRSKTRLVLIVGAALLLVAGGVIGGRALRQRLRPVAQPARTTTFRTEAPKPPPATAVVKPTEPVPVAPMKPSPAKPVKPAPPLPSEPPAPTTGTLRFQADVEGAIAFLDRTYVGKVPVTIDNVAPGPHRVNVSAPGFDSYSEDIDVAPGPHDVLVRFREVRLSEAVQVVHKHGIGSCEGRLVAGLDGIRYETANADHAFAVTLAEVESIEVNYLDKNLRLKVRGGRTYNFTDRSANADKLYVFQRNVEKARIRLAKGDQPARKQGLPIP